MQSTIKAGATVRLAKLPPDPDGTRARQPRPLRVGEVGVVGRMARDGLGVECAVVMFKGRMFGATVPVDTLDPCDAHRLGGA